MIRLVQLTHAAAGRRVAAVEEPQLQLVRGVTSVYQLASEAIGSDTRIEKLIKSRGFEKEPLDYDAIYGGKSDWSLLPAFDHPTESARCFVTGTGLTHKASA